MTDVGLLLTPDNRFDIGIANGDLIPDDGLQTAIAISIFTDERVTDAELVFPQKDKKGWWGDMFPEVEGDQIGSKLWLVGRAKITTETQRLAEDYCKDGLQWLIDDGVASKVTVTAAYGVNRSLLINIGITKPDGNTSRFQVIWDKQQLVGA